MPPCKQCSKQATFGYRGSSPTACKAHKQEHMIDLKHPSCLYCDGRPSFAADPGQPATHCKLHKTEDMVNVRHALCSVCGLYASFGTVKNRPERCYAHKTPDMKNVKATQCQAPGCTNINPKYGNGDLGRAFCELHYNHQTCWKVTTCCAPNCINIATHSDNASAPFVFCGAHTPPQFSAATLHVCVHCEEVTLCNNNNECYRRCVLLKTTEALLLEFFLSKQLSFVHNRCAPGTNKRPDFLFTTPYGYVVVENDEHCHAGVPAQEEVQRMTEIQGALQKPVHFIRFNPDYTRVHTEALSDRHELLYQVLLPLLQEPELFFVQQPALSLQFLFY